MKLSQVTIRLRRGIAAVPFCSILNLDSGTAVLLGELLVRYKTLQDLLSLVRF